MTYTLHEVNEFIRRVLALNFQEPVWLKCELADIKPSRGHYYLDLVQKKEEADEIVAQGQAVIWQTAYRALHKKLGLQLHGLLQPGMEVLLLARPEFHERYGLKFVIEDIDPSYTLGKLEMKRRDTLLRLHSLGLVEKNKQRPLPPVLQRIAVLSSEQAAGYQDFVQQLQANPFGYGFQLQLFPAAVQGLQVEKEMIAQLDRIGQATGRFDAVAILRGGGAKLDLAAFDSFELGKTVAQMPLPVLSGIGHDVDQTVLDLVAHTSLKTPTAVADFILHRNTQFEATALELGRAAATLANHWAQRQSQRLGQFAQLVGLQSKSLVRQQGLMLDFIEKEIPSQTAARLSKSILQLDNLENSLRLLSPETALKRGFGIVSKAGKALSSLHEIAEGDLLEVKLQQGSFTSTVKTVHHEQS